MTSHYNPRLFASFKYISSVARATVIFVACLVFIGWLFNINTFKSVFPGFVAMNPNSALAFLLAGISLWLLRKRQAGQWMHRIAQICAFAVAVLGMVTLCEYIFGWNSGINELLLEKGLGIIRASDPVRMAPGAALTFSILALAILLLDTRHGHWLNQFLSLMAVLIPLMTLIGYIFDVEYLHTIIYYRQMALHTALMLVFLSISIFLSHPDEGLLLILNSDNPGAVMARRLLPAAIGIPLVLGWLRLVGQRAGIFNIEIGIAIFVVSSILLFTSLVCWSATLLYRIDMERKQAEEERNRFFTLSLDMMCIAGLDGYFKRLNPVWERTLGFTIEELKSEPFLAFVHPEDREATVAEVQKLSSGNDTIAFENRYRCKDGSYKWMLWNSTPFLEQNLIFAAAREITERKRAEVEIRKLNEDLEKRTVQLEAANKELEAFSYSVSHDLRAPLRATDGFSRILLEEYSNHLDDEGKRFLNIIRTNTQKMGQLIDDLLSFSRISRKEFKKSNIDMTGLARSVVDDLLRSGSAQSASITIEPLTPAHGDSAMLKQVFVNLISNALKFAKQKPNPTVEIGMNTEENGDVYYIKDNGVGFDMNYANKLFGVFQRLHSVEEFEGTGVGLAIVQRIIHRHGGQVWAEAKVNEGATFYFTLPKNCENQGEG
jgi:PAS domain S-box-containing protein